MEKPLMEAYETVIQKIENWGWFGDFDIYERLSSIDGLTSDMMYDVADRMESICKWCTFTAEQLEKEEREEF